MSPANLTVEAWPVTDAGQAEQNEDFVLVHQPEDEDVLRYSGRLYIVADGQGGGMRGQIASRYAAQKVMYEYYNSDEPDLGLRLRQAIVSANADLYQYAQDQPELVRLSTTMVAAVIRGEQMHVASVGDSRAYVIREGRMMQITRDHTLVQQLLDEGAITPEEAREHPRRDVVLRSIGSQPEVNVDVIDFRLRADDGVLLCTDGLTRYLHEDEIERIVATSLPRSAAETLVQKAVDRGAKDNVTVLSALLRAGGPPLESYVPHTWDGTAPSLDEIPTLLMRAAEEAPSREGMDETLRAQPIRPEDESDVPADATRRATPISREGDTVPAPPYQADVQPAPSYHTGDWPGSEGAMQAPEAPGEGPESAPAPPSGYTIDPVTGLPPVPHQGTQPRQPYQPRIYQPPAQPGVSRRSPQRGVSVGLFAAVGLIAVLLTALMVVLLVNPMGWDLPVGGRGDETEVASQPTEAVSTDPAAVAPTDEPTEAAEPTEEPAAEPTEEAAPTTEAAPEGMVLISSPNGFLRGVSDEEAQAARDACVEQTAGEGICLLEYFTDAQPVQTITISPFFIDITEVTNQQYAICVAEGVCSAPGNTEFYDDPAFANHPVVYVTYDQAAQYCQWAGKRLPTEAEWEMAARWNVEEQTSYIYPWGNTWEDGRANTLSAQLGGLSAVGAFARDRSPYGVLDMAGNATEWVQDWYYPGYEGLSARNPARTGNPALDEPLRVARGGNYQALTAFSRAGHRYDVNQMSSEPWLGFRCAQDTAATLAGEAPTEPADTAPPEDATTPTDEQNTTPEADTTTETAPTTSPEEQSVTPTP